ncbi:MAG: PDZ domain-containing protein [Nigerium sp.]|nr:PDZ domain-containing protein [Nigerium sp.]
MVNGTAAQPGAVVATVTAGSPAEAGGVKVGDVIVAVDGHTVTSTADLLARVGASQVGETMMMTVVRAGATLVLPVVPAAAPG